MKYSFFSLSSFICLYVFFILGFLNCCLHRGWFYKRILSSAVKTNSSPLINLLWPWRAQVLQLEHGPGKWQKSTFNNYLLHDVRHTRTHQKKKKTPSLGSYFFSRQLVFLTLHKLKLSFFIRRKWSIGFYILTLFLFWTIIFYFITFSP